MKKIDQILEWKGFGGGFGKWDSKCRIRIYDHDGFEVCVVTELPDNPGTSITNCAETLAGMAIAHFGLNFQRFIWIEHYLADDRGALGVPAIFREESFDLVSFGINVQPNPLDPKGRVGKAKFVNPQWKRLKKAHVESLIGEDLNNNDMTTAVGTIK